MKIIIVSLIESYKKHFLRLICLKFLVNLFFLVYNPFNGVILQSILVCFISFGFVYFCDFFKNKLTQLIYNFTSCYFTILFFSYSLSLVSDFLSISLFFKTGNTEFILKGDTLVWLDAFNTVWCTGETDSTVKNLTRISRIIDVGTKSLESGAVVLVTAKILPLGISIKGKTSLIVFGVGAGLGLTSELCKYLSK